MAGVVHVKLVKPVRLNDAEFRRIARNAMRRVARGMKKDFEKTTEHWKHEVIFKEHTAASSKDDFIATEVSTGDEVWGMLNHGTKPHLIWAGIYTGKSNKKVLAFPSAFTPKTVPRALFSGPGSSGGETVRTPYVEHPGTKERAWTKVIAEKWKTPFKNEVIRAMREWKQKSHLSG